MKISTRGRYGLKAMVDIAANAESKCVSLKSVAKRQGISEHYLEQLISSLKKAEFVKSVRGAQGGYVLNKSPKDILVGDILRVLEGSLYPVMCIDNSEESSCGTANCNECSTKIVWEKIYTGLSNVVDSITLEELVKNYEKIYNNI